MIRILIADDHSIVREGIKHIIEDESDMRVVAEAADGLEVLSLLSPKKFDLVILDISMPEKSGLDVLKDIKVSTPDLPVLILTMHAEEQYATRVLKAGASGYLTKESVPGQLINAIRKIVSGGIYISEKLAEKLAMNVGNASNSEPHELLSDREYQVFVGLAAGTSPTKLAGELSLSVKTISTYRARILSKMGLKNNADIIHYAIENNIKS
jgi:two-component system, NarL family, invasion response regulator UvrY